MQRTHFTIAGTMVAISLVAVDLVTFGPLLSSGRSYFGRQSDPFFDASVLPLAVALQVLLVAAVNRRGRIRPALVGFQVTGWIALAAFLAVCSVPGLMIRLLNGVGESLQAAGLDVAGFNRRSQSDSLLKLTKLSIAALVLMAPPWLASMAGAVVAARFARRRMSSGPVGGKPSTPLTA